MPEATVMKDSINVFNIDGENVQILNPERGLNSFMGYAIRRVDDTGDIVYDGGFVYDVGKSLSDAQSSMGEGGDGMFGYSDAERLLQIAWFEQMKRNHGIDDIKNLTNSEALNLATEKAFEL